MKRIKKHEFEAVSLLTVDKGLLDITVIPAEGQPDWIVPTSLILSVDAYDERIWTYLWQGREVAVYQLIPKDVTPDKIVVLEGNTDVHRIGLQTRGELRQIQASISDIHDTAMPLEYLDDDDDDNNDNDKIPSIESSDDRINEKVSDVAPVRYAGEFRGSDMAYVYQTVRFEDVIYLVPDLDELAHKLVDLDS